MSISSRQAPEPQRQLEPESVAAIPSTTIRAVCRRSPRKTPKRDGIRRDLEEAATPIATTPHAAASTPPPVPTMTKPFHAISEPFEFGSPAQPPRSNAEFAHSQAAFASYDYVKAEEAIRRELEARTGRRISTEPVVVTAKAQTKATAQQALGQRYDSSHQREFQKCVRSYITQSKADDSQDGLDRQSRLCSSPSQLASSTSATNGKRQRQALGFVDLADVDGGSGSQTPSSRFRYSHRTYASR